MDRGTFRTLRVTFDEASARLPETLQKEGFGIITQIDLQQTFKAKLGKGFRRYRIFGACNPGFALQALEEDPHVGVLLPCNVVLHERTDGQTEIGVIDPLKQMDDPRFAKLAGEVRARLVRVAESIDA